MSNEIQNMHSKLLSPSVSGLWMTCTAMPQALLDIGYVNVSGNAANRGTLQHGYAEKLKKKEIDMVCPSDLDSDEWDQVIVATDSIDKFLELEGSNQMEKIRDYYELQVAFSDWRAECFGTVDFVRVDFHLRRMYVLDYKFGRIGVDADMNTQLLIYAMGTIYTMLRKKVDLRDMVDEIIIGIAQPKVSKNLATFRLSMTDLLNWDKEVLQPAQKLVIEGEGVFVPGPHCKNKYCKVGAYRCPAAAKKMEEAMSDFMDMYTGEKEEGKTIGSLSIEELATFLSNIPLAKMFIEAAEARAYELLDRGKDVPGYKLVEGQGKRVWKDAEEADKFLASMKIKVADRKPPKLVTAPQAEKLLKAEDKMEKARDRFKELVEYKPGSVQLVPESHPSPRIVKEEVIDQDILDMFGEVEESMGGESLEGLLSGVEGEVLEVTEFAVSDVEDLSLDDILDSL